MKQQRRYQLPQRKPTSVLPNHWDFISIGLILAVFIGLIKTTQSMSVPYQLGTIIPISLNPSNLPAYAIRSVMRMGIALLFSLLFTFIFGTWAAKNKWAEKIIIPSIDVLQSVPILGFLTIVVAWFINLFPGKLLGPECAAIFAIFTSQAWNMAMSFYQSLKTTPRELHEASAMFHLNAWQKFWRIEVPFAAPALLWNTMMSLSGGWFFVVASEAISVANQNITLPGIGSYIQLAINQGSIHAIIYAITTMLIVILVYDQLIFRPLISWSERFKAEQESGTSRDSSSWVITIASRTHLLKHIGKLFAIWSDHFVNFKFYFLQANATSPIAKQSTLTKYSSYRKHIIFTLITLLLGYWFYHVNFASYFQQVTKLAAQLHPQEIWQVMLLGLITGLRVLVLILLCSLVWVPIGVWIGFHPKATQYVQPLVQFLAAFPANLLYPVFVIAILYFQLNVEIWTAPLMILGTQWYILFNVIAGAAAIPKDLKYAVNNLGVSGWLWWKKMAIPAIFPYFITGAMTAAGGAWNASIVAEVISWKNTTLQATGLGAYITKYSQLGDYTRMLLGIIVMSIYVTIINRLLWQKLYRLAESRFYL